MSFITAGSWVKYTIFGAARKFFSPADFETALAPFENFKDNLSYIF